MIPKMELTLQNTIAGAGVFTLGILAGRYWSSAGTNISGKKVVAKSYNSDGDPIKTYCVQHSTPLSAIQEKCMSETLKHPRARMLGAPEVITLNAALIKALGGKKVRHIQDLLKFRFSEKVTKIWSYLPLSFNITW